MVSSKSTPANMIMAGILQCRNFYGQSFNNGQYYHAARWLYNLAGLLPKEAWDNGFKLTELPKLGTEKTTIAIEDGVLYRGWIEDNDFIIHKQIPTYVYQYFQRGMMIKRGY